MTALPSLEKSNPSSGDMSVDCVDNPIRLLEGREMRDFAAAVMIAVILMLHIAIIPIVISEIRRD